MGFSLLTEGRNYSIVRQFVISGTSSGQDSAYGDGCHRMHLADCRFLRWRVTSQKLAKFRFLSQIHLRSLSVCRKSAILPAGSREGAIL